MIVVCKNKELIGRHRQKLGWRTIKYVMMGAHSERFDQYLQIQDIAKLDKEIENITAESAKQIDNVKAEYVAELNL